MFGFGMAADTEDREDELREGDVAILGVLTARAVVDGDEDAAMLFCCGAATCRELLEAVLVICTSLPHADGAVFAWRVDCEGVAMTDRSRLQNRGWGGRWVA